MRFNHVFSPGDYYAGLPLRGVNSIYKKFVIQVVMQVVIFIVKIINHLKCGRILPQSPLFS